MIRVLHIFNMMGNGGVEHFVMERYRMLDRSKVQFDFLMTSNEPGYFEQEIGHLGGIVYHTYPLTKNPLRAFWDIRRIVKENNYLIVHRHTGNAIGYFDLRAARSGGAKHLIMHSHNTSAERLKLHYYAKRFLAFNCIRFACSHEAGKWLFDNNDFIVVPNAIEVDKYRFSSELREKYREKYKLEDALVVGHVGRMDYQKNHEFLVDIFYELLKIHPNSKLVCVGDGHLKSCIEKKVNALNISDKVIFTGSINNVNEIMNAFDIFCLPSKYEGLGITLIEAQANGLPCLASLNRVPEEANVSGLIRYIPVEDSASVWAREISKIMIQRDLSAADKLVSEGYNLLDSVEFLQSFYEGVV